MIQNNGMDGREKGNEDKHTHTNNKEGRQAVLAAPTTYNDTYIQYIATTSTIIVLKKYRRQVAKIDENVTSGSPFVARVL